MSNTAQIPSLGNTVNEILNSIFSIETGGFDLVFYVLDDKMIEFRLSSDPNKPYLETIWQGNIPLEGKRVSDDTFAFWLSKGVVGIYLQSKGKNPSYKKEIHRARGTKIPFGWD